MATIKKTIQGGADPTRDLDGFLRDMEEYAKLGIDHGRGAQHVTRPGGDGEGTRSGRVRGSPRSGARKGLLLA